VIEDLRLLVELQAIDSAILKKTALIDAIPQKVSSSEQSLKDAQSSYEKHKQRCDSLEKKKRDKERFLDEINENIKKLKGRTAEIKTNKEYQAHLKEIEAAEKERLAAEDEVLSLMEAIDAAYKVLKAEEARVVAEKEKVEAFKKETDRKVEELRRELDELKHRREGLVKLVDKEVYGLYFKILETKGGLAVVEARDEVCQGCNMNIPPQLFVEIKRNDRIIQCPQCGRILYWKEMEKNSSQGP